MKLTYLSILSTLFFSSLPLAAEPEGAKEPPLNFVLKIGEREYKMEEGKAVELDAVKDKSKAKIVVGKSRTFPYAGIEFEYPSYFSYEAEVTDPDAKNWSLDGIDLLVMFFDAETDIGVNVFANLVATGMAKELGIPENNIELKEHDLAVTLAGEKIAAKKLTTSLGNLHVAFNVIPLKAKKGRIKLLLITDMQDAENTDTKELKEFMKLLQTSFKYKK